MIKIRKECPYYEAKCNDLECECPKYLAYKEVSKPGVIDATLAEIGVDTITDNWELLMTMQKKFEESLHPVDGLSKEEIDHWVDRYLVCIEDEVREAREHLDIYPNEKTKERNEVELKKEIIDILHFVMDLFICAQYNGNQIKEAYCKSYNVDNVEDLLSFSFKKEKGILYFYEKNNDNDFLLMLNRLLDKGGDIRQQISWMHWKKPNATINNEKLLNACVEQFKILIQLFILLDMNEHEVKDIYVKKNVENIYRQKFNY